MANKNERMRILEMIENGQLSVEQGLQMLDAVADEEQPAPQGISSLIEESAGPGEFHAPGEPPSEEAIGGEQAGPGSDVEILGGPGPGVLPEGADRWRRYWVIPLWVGVSITVLGGWLMYLAMEASGIGFWFICATILFLLGLLLLVLAWGSRSAPWIHLRVQQEPGEWPQHIAISFPIPVRTSAWFLRRFGHRIPNLGDTAIDDLVLALDESTSSENPIYIEVDEGDGGEKVEIYIG